MTEDTVFARRIDAVLICWCEVRRSGEGALAPFITLDVLARLCRLLDDKSRRVRYESKHVALAHVVTDLTGMPRPASRKTAESIGNDMLLYIGRYQEDLRKKRETAENWVFSWSLVV